jgi:hypothetical protein
MGIPQINSKDESIARRGRLPATFPKLARQGRDDGLAAIAGLENDWPCPIRESWVLTLRETKGRKNIASRACPNML